MYLRIWRNFIRRDLRIYHCRVFTAWYLEARVMDESMRERQHTQTESVWRAFQRKNPEVHYSPSIGSNQWPIPFLGGGRCIKIQ